MTNELAKTPSELERPSYIKTGDARGTEHLKKEDLQMPRLAIAQSQSPELKPTEAKYIDGLRQGEMFNNLTHERMGMGPLYFTIVRADPPRGIEFNPREQGGGVKDLNVSLDDPRMQFGPDGEKPVATKFYDFIIMTLPIDEASPGNSLIALSLKSSGLKVARQLNSLMKYRDAPSFTGRYELKVVPEKNAKGDWFNFSVRNAGWVTEAEVVVSEKAYETLKDRVLVIERDSTEPDSGDASFDTDKM